MNRKFQHTVQALATTSAVFGLLLFAGAPAEPGLTDPAALMAAAEADVDAALDPREAEADAEAARTGHAGPGTVRRSHRAALAMPYFSFGDGGLRRVTGG